MIFSLILFTIYKSFESKNDCEIDIFLVYHKDLDFVSINTKIIQIITHTKKTHVQGKVFSVLNN